jgi:hydrogenase/urease accessory protein HupE
MTMLVLALSGEASAHPEGFSGLRVMVDNGKLQAVLTLHTRDLSQWFPAGKYPNYVFDVCDALTKSGPELLQIECDGKEVQASSVHASSPEAGMLEIDLEYPLDARATHLTIWSKHLVRLPRGHQQLFFVQDVRQLAKAGVGQTLLEDNLSTDHDAVDVDLPAVMPAGSTETRAPSAASVSTTPRISFFALGVEHILTGYDHLLFLAALLLVCKNFRQAASIITFFTIAHSITLSLAALDIVRLPGRIVEPAIAASVVYVGLENIFGRHRFAWRALVTFGFGLVHGLGFASALREVGLGSTSVGVAMPLLKFSMGLESGQLCIAAVLLQLMLWLRTRPQFERQWVPAGSMLVAVVGGYWLITRVVAG